MKKRGRSRTLLSELDILILKKLMNENKLCITELMKKTKSGNKDISKKLFSLLKYKLIKKEKISNSRKICYSISNEKRDFVMRLLEIFKK